MTDQQTLVLVVEVLGPKLSSLNQPTNCIICLILRACSAKDPGSCSFKFLKHYPRSRKGKQKG